MIVIVNQSKKVTKIAILSFNSCWAKPLIYSRKQLGDFIFGPTKITAVFILIWNVIHVFFGKPIKN
jgi:hypothetical protein